MADDGIDRIPRDMLFVACTRPTMLWGVPAEGFVINFFACYLAFLWIAHANILSIKELSAFSSVRSCTLP